MEASSIRTSPIDLALKTLRIRAGERMGTLVVLGASILSLGSLIFFYCEGLTLAYGDAAAHLNIARRVIDNITPGIAQLGGIWLPFPHVLMLPLIWIDPLWRTGLAGSLVSMVAYIASAWFLYGAVAEVTEDKLAGLAGALVFMASLSMLYMQSTAMSEPVMIGTSLMALYFLVKWAKYGRDVYLHMVGLGVFLASLSRYDGWFYLPTVTLCVLLTAFVAKGETYAEGITLAFLSLATYGILLWLFYNWLIFGDPLSFAFGVGSAFWYEQRDLASGIAAGVPPLKWNLILCIRLYGWAVVDVLGWLAVPLLTLGFIAYCWKYGLQTKYLAGYVFLSPLAFNILSPFLGLSIMRSIHVPPSTTWYNVRYGLMTLPTLAFFAGCLVAGKWWKKMLLVIVILVQASFLWPVRTMPIIQDPLRAVGTRRQEMETVAQVLHKNYKGR